MLSIVYPVQLAHTPLKTVPQTRQTFEIKKLIMRENTIFICLNCPVGQMTCIYQKQE